ncbi:MAG: fasciclin domain-containing protein, partial [Gemmataceae bacterium]|nr:fasciclin domain-containing protein [Gemmataceae bacterium]
MSKLLCAAAFVALVFVVTPARAADEKNLAEIVAGSKDHTILLKLVKEAGLVDALTGKDDLTVFAPTDEAFKKVPEETLKKVAGDKELLKKVLTSHVVKGKVMAADAIKLDGKEAETLSGAKFKITVKDKS